MARISSLHLPTEHLEEVLDRSCPCDAVVPECASREHEVCTAALTSFNRTSRLQHELTTQRLYYFPGTCCTLLLRHPRNLDRVGHLERYDWVPRLVDGCVVDGGGATQGRVGIDRRAVHPAQTAETELPDIGSGNVPCALQVRGVYFLRPLPKSWVSGPG